MSARRAERLVNLVICLLSTRQYLTAERIRAVVPGYEPDDGTARSNEAFKRMFERDKTELRELAVPLETGHNSMGDIEDGYRIARRDYELPDISLTADEATAVGLAARLWQSAGMAAAADGALRKLRAAGIAVDVPAGGGIEPRIAASEPAFAACLEAVRAGQPIRFGYRRPDGSEPQQRTVEPWGVVSWRGRWYLVGHDRLRAATRCFRLSRISGAVSRVGVAGSVQPPAGIDLTAIVAADTPVSLRTARVRVAPGRAQGLRRSAVGAQSGDELDIGYADPESLADRLVGYGAAVVVLDPPEVRDAVVRKLRAAAAS